MASAFYKSREVSLVESETQNDQHKELPQMYRAALLLCTSIITAFVPALLTGSIIAAAQFTLAFAGLFVLPLIPWVLMLDKSMFEQWALATVLGIAGIPIVFFIIGVLNGPLTLPVFVGVPLVVFVIGGWMLKKKVKNERKNNITPVSAIE